MTQILQTRFRTIFRNTFDRLKLGTIVCGIFLIYWSSNIDNLGLIVASSLGTTWGNFVGHGCDAIFASGGRCHNGSRRLAERKIRKGAEVCIIHKVARMVVARDVVAKAVVARRRPDCGTCFCTRPRVTGCVGDSVTTKRLCEFARFVGGNAIALARGAHSEGGCGGRERVRSQGPQACGE